LIQNEPQAKQYMTTDLIPNQKTNTLKYHKIEKQLTTSDKNCENMTKPVPTSETIQQNPTKFDKLRQNQQNPTKSNKI
jgi:hypothetical protein